jgi:hypothetical protein
LLPKQLSRVTYTIKLVLRSLRSMLQWWSFRIRACGPLEWQIVKICLIRTYKTMKNSWISWSTSLRWIIPFSRES